MTYRILIVDDELVDLEWMKRRIQSSGKRLEIAAAVNNAFTAIDIVKNERVDIIVSDIRMPIMSGIEFIREVKQIDKDVRVMFVSGHKEFEYAKQAVDFGAFGYLLKPVEDKELSDKLDAVIEELDAAFDRNQVTLKLKETSSKVKRELMFRWLEGEHTELESHVEPNLEDKVQANGVSAAVVEVDQPDWRIDVESGEDWQQLCPVIFRFIDDYVEEKGWGHCLQGDVLRKVLLLFGDEHSQGERLEELIAQVSNRFPVTITVGLGFHTDDTAELPDSYQAAKTALATKWLAGKNKKLTWDGSSVSLEIQTNSAVESQTEIVQALAEYNLTAIDDWIEQLFRQLQNIESKHTVFQHVVHAIVKLNEQFVTFNENFDELMEWEKPFPNHLLEFETLFDLKSWLRRKFFAFSEKWYLKKQRQKRKLILEIMRYTEKLTDEKVTLKKTADHFGFSANYLGQLYKQETGQHFSDYIIEHKIKRACLLLQDPTIKIYEVSEKTGYKNIIYFNRQFKQLTGMSPGNYRKRLNI